MTVETTCARVELDSGSKVRKGKESLRFELVISIGIT